jgi:CheY-like chemotaxis protein
MAKTLLLADGSVTIQRVVDLTFAHEDIRVVSVSDGSRAIKFLDNDKPDIVLVDVDLSEVDGYGIVSHMKKSKKLNGVPVLMLAGAFEPVDQDKARSLGCDGIVVKPFEPQHLVARVKELLAAAVGVGKSVASREPAGKAPTYSGPSDSPSLAILRAGAGRAPEPEMKIPKLDPLSSRAEPSGPSAFVRGTPLEPMPQAAPERLELPTRPVWDTSAHGPMQPAPVAPAPAPLASALPSVATQAAPAKVSLASAFSALLAAEQSTQPPAPAAAQVQVITEASVEDAVRRVLVRMTDDLVRRIVVETAERLIREEIEKIKENPE